MRAELRAWGLLVGSALCALAAVLNYAGYSTAGLTVLFGAALTSAITAASMFLPARSRLAQIEDPVKAVVTPAVYSVRQPLSVQVVEAWPSEDFVIEEDRK